jgi:hypothetical protein
VGEGNFDVRTYTELLCQFGVASHEFRVQHAGGKGNVFRMNNWVEFPGQNSRIATQMTLQNDQRRSGFRGVIIVVDSDQNTSLMQNYAHYSQECRSMRVAYNAWQQLRLTSSNSILLLDTLKGINGQKLPIYGLCVPLANEGCLESELLIAHGYPVNDEDYDSFASTIKKATQNWGIEKPKSGDEWWEPKRNGKARMDKFMYTALKKGFEVSDVNTALLREPQIITRIKEAMRMSPLQDKNHPS